MKTHNLAILEKALRIAAKERYELLEMKPEDKWIDDRIEKWIEEAKK